MRETTLCYIEKDGCWLMLFRNRKQHDPNQGKWIGIGGGIEPGETADACLEREVLEETGLHITRYKKRGVIQFRNDACEDENMHVYTADGFFGDLREDCDEGELAWIPTNSVLSLPLWEGDRIFLHLLLRNAPYFELTLNYHGEALVSALLDGAPCRMQPFACS